MIDVIYDRKRLIVKVKGHAQSGEAGHDLVCAAGGECGGLCWTSGRATPPSPVRRCMACRR